MYQKISAKYLLFIFISATALIYFGFIVAGSILLAGAGVIIIAGSIRREIARKHNHIEYPQSTGKDIYIDLVYGRGNIYKIYNQNPDATLDAL